MVDSTEVQFALSDDVHIAYKVVGSGPIDLVSVEGSLSHLETKWELPAYRRYYERLGEIARVILFDKRGMGMSDRVPGATSLDTRMDDIRAVMDAVGSERAFLMGASEGGPLSMLFAAAHPARCEGLILIGAEVREKTDEDWQWGEGTEEEFEAAMATIHEKWGRTGTLRNLAPSVADEPWANEFIRRLQRNAGTPGTAEAFMRMAFEIDARSIVSSVNVPTLILHARNDRVCHIENARYLAQHMPHARLVEMTIDDHVPWFQPEEPLAEIIPFITGRQDAVVADRILTTVLFTDIVDSTRRAADLGDEMWHHLLESHNQIVRTNLGRHRGIEVNTGGDSFLAMFDGPARAVRCAQDAAREIRQLGLDIRAGIHTGEVERIGDDLAGLGVHIGARIAALAGPGEVLVSSTVRDLVAGSGLTFDDRGSHMLRGVPGKWRVLAALDPKN
jgi:pimeloyl-ACP methyl ester carboxylesterase